MLESNICANIFAYISHSISAHSARILSTVSCTQSKLSDNSNVPGPPKPESLLKLNSPPITAISCLFPSIQTTCLQVYPSGIPNAGLIFHSLFILPLISPEKYNVNDFFDTVDLSRFVTRSRCRCISEKIALSIQFLPKNRASQKGVPYAQPTRPRKPPPHPLRLRLPTGWIFSSSSSHSTSTSTNHQVDGSLVLQTYAWSLIFNTLLAMPM